MRDLNAIGIKLKYVLIPKEGDHAETLKQLRDCEQFRVFNEWGQLISTVRTGDLWGPLVVCLTLSM
jgi:hypothetical protein